MVTSRKLQSVFKRVQVAAVTPVVVRVLDASTIVPKLGDRYLPKLQQSDKDCVFSDDKLFSKYFRLVQHIIRSKSSLKIRRKVDIEQLTLNVLYAFVLRLRIYEANGQTENTEHLAIIRTITHRHFCNEARRLKRKKCIDSLVIALNDSSEPYGKVQYCNPEVDVDLNELLNYVLAACSPQQCRIVELRRLGETNVEIASQFCMSVRWVELSLSMVEAKVRRVLANPEERLQGFKASKEQGTRNKEQNDEQTDRFIDFRKIQRFYFALERVLVI